MATSIAVFKGKEIRKTIHKDQWWFSVSAEAAFGVTPEKHKKIKGLKRENLRDHMTDLKLIFSMLGEAATTEITRVDDAKGFQESRHAARKGGEVAGKARKDLEQKTGRRVVSRENYLTTTQEMKRIERK